ncbi:MAG: choice-of-anchor Q domain-containing protein [Acidobacteriaceae bacterium]
MSQVAAGANDGTSCGNAHSAAWFNTAGNWGRGAGQIGPGTTVHLCGTVNSSLTFSASGASGSPIELLFEPGAQMSAPVFNVGISTAGHSWLIIDGGSNGVMQNTNNSSHGRHDYSHMINADYCSNCEIRNLHINNVYVHSGTGSEVDQTTVRCVTFSGSNVSVHNNVMHDAGWCLVNEFNTGDSNIRIYNNDISNIDHGIALASGGISSVGPFYIYGNHVHDYANWHTSNNAYHHDGIHGYTTGGHAPHINGGVWIYNNTFDGSIDGNFTAHIFLEGTLEGTPFMDTTSTAYVFNNVFSSTGQELGYGVLQIYGGTGHQVLNNTFAWKDPATSFCFYPYDAKNITFKNNVASGCGWLTLFAGSSTFSPPNVDYNAYSNCTDYNCFDAVTQIISTWRNNGQCAGCDIHSKAPRLGPGTNTSPGLSSTYAPLPGSSAIATGQNLYNISGWPTEQRTAFQHDLRGAPRPTSGAWDAGAVN